MVICIVIGRRFRLTSVNFRLLKRSPQTFCSNHENVFYFIFSTSDLHIITWQMARYAFIKTQCLELIFSSDYHLLFNSSDYSIQSSQNIIDFVFVVLLFFFLFIHPVSFVDNLWHRIHAPTPIVSLISIRHPYMVRSSLKKKIYLMQF